MLPWLRWSLDDHGGPMHTRSATALAVSSRHSGRSSGVGRQWTPAGGDRETAHSRAADVRHGWRMRDRRAPRGHSRVPRTPSSDHCSGSRVALDMPIWHGAGERRRSGAANREEHSIPRRDEGDCREIELRGVATVTGQAHSARESGRGRQRSHASLLLCTLRRQRRAGVHDTAHAPARLALGLLRRLSRMQ